MVRFQMVILAAGRAGVGSVVEWGEDKTIEKR